MGVKGLESEAYGVKLRNSLSELFSRLTGTFRADAPPRPKVENPYHEGGGNGLLVPSLSLPPSVTPRADVEKTFYEEKESGRKVCSFLFLLGYASGRS